MTGQERAESNHPTYLNRLLSWIGWYDGPLTRLLYLFLSLGVIALLGIKFWVNPWREQEAKQRESRIVNLSKESGCDVIFMESIRSSDHEIALKMYCRDGRIGFVVQQGDILHLTRK